LAVLHGELGQLGDGERVVVAHSCGVALWLLAAPQIEPAERVDRVLLVAPPGRSAFIPPYRAFLPVDLDRAAVARASAAPPLVLTSDNDPYCSEGLEEYRAVYTDALGLHHRVLPGAGHVSIEDGFGPWPAVLNWCLQAGDPWARSA
jgi:predicted alpha/beta hydrolase family esterase